MKILFRISIFILFIFYSFDVFASTIGAASGSVTSDGRPLIWKTRDRYSNQISNIYYNTSYPINFVSVVDSGSTYSWLGVNEKGFAIVNSASRDLLENRQYGNASLMRHALGTLSTLEEFEAFLDSTNIVGRNTYANYAALDSLGNVAIYETSNTNYWKFDVNDSENGFLVRTNFSFNGGGDNGTDRYIRSNFIIENLIEEGDLTPKNVLKNQVRDFSDANSEEVIFPFENQSSWGKPYGFFDTSYSISGYESVNGAVIQGILPGESPFLSVMYAIIGNPMTSVAFPYFPTGFTSEYSCSSSISFLMNIALQNREKLYSYSEKEFVDSYLLTLEEGSYLYKLLNLEDEIISQTEVALAEWREDCPSYEIINNFQNNLIVQYADSLSNITLNDTLIADFDIYEVIEDNGIRVTFLDKSLHNPTNWFWDFNNDGIVDSNEQNPTTFFDSFGEHQISLRVSNNNYSDSISLTKDIQLTDVDDHIVEFSDSILYGNYPNPFNPNTKISFYLNKRAKVNLEIFDMRGRKIKKIIKRKLDKGTYFFDWDGTDKNGNSVASGVYLIKLRAGREETVKRAILLK